jgi:dolichol-phosphate mannosyltransferase
MPYNPVLAVVIPVYNEEENISDLLRDWHRTFTDAGIFFRIIMIDDGSKDGSLCLLRRLQQNDPSLSVYTQSNAGHGPAILKGYRIAVDIGAEWVFQIDSDHQLDVTAFGKLWEERDRYDFLLAERKEKNATLPRNCLSWVSGRIVYLLYGRGVKDVNCPYRLIRASQLRYALARIPDDSFAPNILLTSWFLRKRKNRIFTTTTEPRRERRQRQSKMNNYFLLGALRSAFQTILFRTRV